MLAQKHQIRVIISLLWSNIYRIVSWQHQYLFPILQGGTVLLGLVTLTHLSAGIAAHTVGLVVSTNQHAAQQGGRLETGGVLVPQHRGGREQLPGLEQHTHTHTHKRVTRVASKTDKLKVAILTRSTGDSRGFRDRKSATKAAQPLQW